MRTALLFLTLASVVFSQPVERPRTPDAATLASRTSQIKAWYLYAVSLESKLAALTPAPVLLSGIDVIKISLTAERTALTVAWDYVNQGQCGFQVERSTDGVNFGAPVVIADPAARSFVDKHLAPGSYWYRVRAYKAAEISKTSNVAKAAL